MTLDNPPDAPIFAASLRPYRSLSPRGFMLVMGALVACSFTAGLAFWSMGAWPIVGFFGLDILLVQVAFRLNYRQARAHEEVVVFRDRMTVTSVSARGESRESEFNPYWARLEVERHPEIGVTRVTIASHGRRLDVAGFLGPWERESFADALSAALAKARAAPA
ncbi:MAG: DUF2244 domain-containing protein [Rhizobiales bacterium]|nr:DUF2244 domain-containing protein [Hyphomicrobiales bacterium]